MTYHVAYTKRVEKSLAKMDKHAAKVIVEWIGSHLDGAENPRLYGKPLVGNRSGAWRYRVGDYRLIADIQDARVLILLVDVAHRSTVYR